MRHYPHPWLKNICFYRRIKGRKVRNWSRLCRVIHYNIELLIEKEIGFKFITKIKNPRK
jgi:hypothetical protein